MNDVLAMLAYSKVHSNPSRVSKTLITSTTPVLVNSNGGHSSPCSAVVLTTALLLAVLRLTLSRPKDCLDAPCLYVRTTSAFSTLEQKGTVQSWERSM